MVSQGWRLEARGKVRKTARQGIWRGRVKRVGDCRRRETRVRYEDAFRVILLLSKGRGGWKSRIPRALYGSIQRPIWIFCAMLWIAVGECNRECRLRIVRMSVRIPVGSIGVKLVTHYGGFRMRLKEKRILRRLRTVGRKRHKRDIVIFPPVRSAPLEY